MATIATTLSLSSSTATSDALSFSVSSTINITNPVQGLSRETVVNSGLTTLLPSTVTTLQYIYLRNTDSADPVIVRDVNGTQFATIHALEGMFFCLPANTGLTLQSTSKEVVMEYAMFTKG